MQSRIDWFRIISDLRNIGGMNQCDIAREINVPRSRVRDWFAGNTPRFDDGALLVLLWLNRTQDLKLEYNFAISNNSVAEQMATACLSVRCLAIPRTRR